MGKEVAEFGFYESEGDARRRMIEVDTMSPMASGTADIREIFVIEETGAMAKKLNQSESQLDYYNLKDEG